MRKLLRGKTVAQAAATADDEQPSPTAGDDAMSRTLTQALELLDQDYEDESSASEMIEQTEVTRAFLAQKKRNQSSD
jgi:hypothetical protein